MSTRTAAATTTLAILTVAQHAADYDLDVHDIAAPIGNCAIRVSVPSAQLDAWLDTIVVDHDPVVATATAGYEIVTYAGHINAPIGYVAVTINTARKVFPLRIVGAAS